MDEVYVFRGGLYCAGHGEEIRRILHQAVEDCEQRCPNLRDSEQWPQQWDPFAVRDTDYCEACLAVAVNHHWPANIALLRD